MKVLQAAPAGELGCSSQGSRPVIVDRFVRRVVQGVASRRPHRERTMLKGRLARRVLRASVAALLAGGLLSSSSRPAQDVKGGGKGKQPDFLPAGYDDYQTMLDRLGITKMRRGRD